MHHAPHKTHRPEIPQEFKMFNLLSREEIADLSAGASYYLFGDDEGLAVTSPEFDDALA